MGLFDKGVDYFYENTFKSIMNDCDARNISKKTREVKKDHKFIYISERGTVTQYSSSGATYPNNITKNGSGGIYLCWRILEQPKAFGILKDLMKRWKIENGLSTFKIEIIGG